MTKAYMTPQCFGGGSDIHLVDRMRDKPARITELGVLSFGMAVYVRFGVICNHCTKDEVFH